MPKQLVTSATKKNNGYIVVKVLVSLSPVLYITLLYREILCVTHLDVLFLPDVGLPGPPQSASVIEISPTTVLLDIQHPQDNGGVEIYGFRVQYLLKIDDFMIGIFRLLTNTLYFCCFQGLNLLIINME